MADKRKIEVFVAGCPLCEETVKTVNQLSCESCDVTIVDLNGAGMERAKELGVKAVPAVAVDGKLLDCCAISGPTSEALKAAGIGSQL